MQPKQLDHKLRLHGRQLRAPVLRREHGRQLRAPVRDGRLRLRLTNAHRLRRRCLATPPQPLPCLSLRRLARHRMGPPHQLQTRHPSQWVAPLGKLTHCVLFVERIRTSRSSHVCLVFRSVRGRVISFDMAPPPQDCLRFDNTLSRLVLIARVSRPVPLVLISRVSRLIPPQRPHAPLRAQGRQNAFPSWAPSGIPS